jgi:hypothetical protein
MTKCNEIHIFSIFKTVAFNKDIMKWCVWHWRKLLKSAQNPTHILTNIHTWCFMWSHSWKSWRQTRSKNWKFTFLSLVFNFLSFHVTSKISTLSVLAVTSVLQCGYNDKTIKSLLKGKGLLPTVGLARLDNKYITFRFSFVSIDTWNAFRGQRKTSDGHKADIFWWYDKQLFGQGGGTSLENHVGRQRFV